MLGKKIKLLQRADDKTKKRWLIFSSAFAMTVVIGFWALYLNAHLPGVERKRENSKDKGEASALTTFGGGLMNVYGDLSRGFSEMKKEINAGVSAISKELQRTNNFSVETNNGENLIPENVEQKKETNF